MVFCRILQYFVAKSFFCNLRCFVAKSVLVRFTRFCVEKNLAKNCARGEKMTNMRYALHVHETKYTSGGRRESAESYRHKFNF